MERQAISLNDSKPYLDLRAKRKIPARECAVCKACKEFKELDTLIHQTKFKEVLTVGQVRGRFNLMSGMEVSHWTFINHYGRHLPAHLEIEYRKQASQLSRGRVNGDKEFKPDISRQFDLMVKLKEMFVDLSHRLAQIETTNGRIINPDNLKIYSSMVEELRKLANDISKVELDRSYLKVILIDIYKDVAKELVTGFGEVARSSIIEFVPDEEDRSAVLETIKNGINKVLMKGVGKIESELSKKL